LFYKIDPEHSHETVFFSFNFLIIDFDFEALELIGMHNNEFSELARDLDQVGFLFVCLFVVAKTKHAALFVFFQIFSFTSLLLAITYSSQFVV